MNRLVLMILATAALLAGGGCALGPDYKAPPSAAPAAFENAVGDGREPPREFWKRFEDPVLDGLVDDALKANHDIRIAVASLREARAIRREVDANLWPTVGLSTSAKRQVIPQSEFPGPRDQRTHNAYDASVDASWEANLFGKFSRGSESAAASLSAAEAGVAAAQVSVTGEVAINYFQLRGLQLRLKLAQESLKNQESNLQLVQGRLGAGRGTELDTSRAQAQVEDTRAAIPSLEASIEVTRYRLAVLTGRAPTELAALSAQAQPLPGIAPVESIGTPASLLRRRPDIRVAERQLAAATANIGVAEADLFPTVTFSGLLGLNATNPSGLGSGQAFYYNLGGLINWNILDFGRIRARISQSEAKTDSALAQYEKTVLTALEETEGALVTFNRNQRRADSLFKAAQASKRAAELARRRFEAGVTDFLVVLDAERQLLSDQDSLAQAQTDAGTSLVSVYKALGGGWTATQ